MKEINIWMTQSKSCAFWWFRQNVCQTWENVFKSSHTSFGWDLGSNDGSINIKNTGQSTHRTGAMSSNSAACYMQMMAHSCSPAEKAWSIGWIFCTFTSDGLASWCKSAPGRPPPPRAENPRQEQCAFPKNLKEIPLDKLAANKADFDETCVGGRCITFMDNFRYLGSLISWDLTDGSDALQQFGLASKAFDSLRNDISCDQPLKVVIRVRLFTEIIIKLLLWSCKSWTLTAG